MNIVDADVVLLGRRASRRTALRADQSHRIAPRARRAGTALWPGRSTCCATIWCRWQRCCCSWSRWRRSRHSSTRCGYSPRYSASWCWCCCCPGSTPRVFEGAPAGLWRKRVPTIFRDVTRFVLIAVGLALIFSYVWGVRVGGLFTALGVTSVVIGLMLQNSVGQIVSGLFMLFEQPFRIGDWLDTPTARGRIVEANWRAVHIQTDRGLQITPNSVLAATSFTNLSRPPGAHQLAITTTFCVDRPARPGARLLLRVAGALPQRKPDVAPDVGDRRWPASTEVSIALKSPADDSAAQATFLRWIWYAARREELHLDDADDDFSTPARVQMAMRTVVAPALRLSLTDQQSLIPHAKMVRYGTDEVVQYAGEVPTAMTFLISGQRPADHDHRRRFGHAAQPAGRRFIPRADHTDPSTETSRRVRAGRGDRAGDRSRAHRRSGDADTVAASGVGPHHRRPAKGNIAGRTP